MGHGNSKEDPLGLQGNRDRRASSGEDQPYTRGAMPFFGQRRGRPVTYDRRAFERR